MVYKSIIYQLTVILSYTDNTMTIFLYYNGKKRWILKTNNLL